MLEVYSLKGIGLSGFTVPDITFTDHHRSAELG